MYILSLFFRKRKHYFGDFANEDFSSPLTKKAFQVANKKITEQRKKIKALRQQVTRRENKIRSLTSLLTFLKGKNYISESAYENIQVSLKYLFKISSLKINFKIILRHLYLGQLRK